MSLYANIFISNNCTAHRFGVGISPNHKYTQYLEHMIQESTRAASWTLPVILSTLKPERVH